MRSGHTERSSHQAPASSGWETWSGSSSERQLSPKERGMNKRHPNHARQVHRETVVKFAAVLSAPRFSRRRAWKCVWGRTSLSKRACKGLRRPGSETP